MFEWIQNIFGLYLVLYFLSCAHEFAHVAIARALGVEVRRVEIGCGAKWHVFQRFSFPIYLKRFPLTGKTIFVHASFERLPLCLQGLIYLAGPFSSFFLDLYLYLFFPLKGSPFIIIHK